MKFAFGTKEEMTTIYDEAGKAHAVTAIKIKPLVVVGKRTSEKNGYSALELGLGQRKISKINKALKGKLEKSTGKKLESGFEAIKEYRVNADDEMQVEVGSSVKSIEDFVEGDVVNVSAITKGKGFQGVVKRHGFAGGPRTHGQKHSERAPGSIGATGPQRVLKGVRMAGRMGGKRRTIKNLTVIKVDKDNQLVYISGALPGRRGSLVEIKSSSK